MAVKYKFYARVRGTFINLKGCPITQSALPSKEEIIKAIVEKNIPIKIIVEDDFFEKIKKEVHQKSNNKSVIGILPISFIDPHYKAVVNIIPKKIATIIENKDKNNKNIE